MPQSEHLSPTHMDVISHQFLLSPSKVNSFIQESEKSTQRTLSTLIQGDMCQ